MRVFSRKSPSMPVPKAGVEDHLASRQFADLSEQFVELGIVLPRHRLDLSRTVDVRDRGQGVAMLFPHVDRHDHVG
jgi:hypothetical protein